MVDETLNEIFDLFTKYGDDDYLGEPVSKTVHSIQCGLLAEREGADHSVILGAFFHDIGHLIGERDGLKPMIFEGTLLGTSNHAALGADYLKSRGFGDDVTDIVRAHVVAKRYLCNRNRDYYENLSWASKRTLEFQGGVMSDREAEKFEQDPRHKSYIRMRTWDEQAKDDKWTDLKPLTYFRDMARDYLIKREEKQV